MPQSQVAASLNRHAKPIVRCLTSHRRQNHQIWNITCGAPCCSSSTSWKSYLCSRTVCRRDTTVWLDSCSSWSAERIPIWWSTEWWIWRSHIPKHSCWRWWTQRCYHLLACRNRHFSASECTIQMMGISILDSRIGAGYSRESSNFDTGASPSEDDDDLRSVSGDWIAVQEQRRTFQFQWCSYPNATMKFPKIMVNT